MDCGLRTTDFLFPTYLGRSKETLRAGYIFHELTGGVKAKIAQNNSQVSEGRITVKPGQDSVHELIISKVNPFVASLTCIR